MDSDRPGQGRQYEIAILPLSSPRPSSCRSGVVLNLLTRRVGHYVQDRNPDRAAVGVPVAADDRSQGHVEQLAAGDRIEPVPRISRWSSPE
jgi:hypothetical protein